MKIPPILQALIDDGIVDAVLYPLKSGKEASVYVVRTGDEIRCAKVYKDMGQRSFQRRVQYQEGRKARGSRESRAMSRGTRFGRREAEDAWKNAEVDALYRLFAADVRVPKPHGFYSGVLVMEFVADAEGQAAPRLGEVELAPEQARGFHAFLIGQVVRMLCNGLIHGDLSAYNVLVSADGPVIIDLPQAVDAAGNNNAFAMLRRDVDNLAQCLGRFAPELLETRYAEEMWALFQQGELLPNSRLTGSFESEDGPVDIDAVVDAIESAKEEEQLRQLGRKEADADSAGVTWAD